MMLRNWLTKIKKKTEHWLDRDKFQHWWPWQVQVSLQHQGQRPALSYFKKQEELRKCSLHFEEVCAVKQNRRKAGKIGERVSLRWEILKQAVGSWEQSRRKKPIEWKREGMITGAVNALGWGRMGGSQRTKRDTRFISSQGRQKTGDRSRRQEANVRPGPFLIAAASDKETEAPSIKRLP